MDFKNQIKWKHTGKFTVSQFGQKSPRKTWVVIGASV